MNKIPFKSRSICVFCGAAFGADGRHRAAAEHLGQLIGERGYRLVYGGGGPGLMGVTAGAVCRNGGAVRGILPDFLRGVEKPPEWELDLTITPDLQVRKAMMLAESDGFIVMPGSAGTMDEFFEVLTSAQLQVLGKPIVVVNIAGFFEPLFALLQHLVEQGFARASLLELYTVVETAEDAVAVMAEKLGDRAA